MRDETCREVQTMGNCKLSDELNRLRKSSSESIDNTEKFDRFKKYMHVTRNVEEDLKNILRNVNNSGRKTLVLLCGSAGDGKSHLLSFLKNSDEEQLLNGYTIYNDATESSSPLKTAIETLNDLLKSFKDDQLELPGSNVILAINLGVLSNFIESEYGKEFTELRKYVEKSNILTTRISNEIYTQNGHFQHVSFSDYQMYSLNKDGIDTGYISEIFKKVFDAVEENYFYQSYKNNCEICPLSKKCPVKMNYEFMMSEKRQIFVAKLLIETVIKDKVILTTREILNFIYTIIVSQEFSFAEIKESQVDISRYLKKFIRQITPSLLFDSVDVTLLMNVINKYDPLHNRSEKADESAIAYYIKSDITEEIEKVFNNVSYGKVFCDETIISKLSYDKMLKANLFKLLVRVDAIDNNMFIDEVYNNFLSDLFVYNLGRGKALGKLYEMVEHAVIQWCGSDKEGNVCLNDNHDSFSLYESIKFNENLDNLPVTRGESELKRLIPFVVTSFEDNDGKIINLDIDYSLYELLAKLNKGYIQTADDRNNHADFISFIDKILHTGELGKEVLITSEDGKKAIISSGKFGFKFKVVK